MQNDSPSIAISNKRFGAVFYACTDTWVLGVILLMLFTLGMTYWMLFIDMEPGPSGAPARLVLLTLAIWIFFGGLVTPRFLTSYAISRRGQYVLGKVINHEDFGIGEKASTRLNVRYIREGKH